MGKHHNMGRPQQRRAPQQRGGKAGRKHGGRFGSKNVHAISTEEFDDDIDKFHKGADKIPLDVNEDLDLSDDNMEEPVFDLKAESSSEDDDEGSDDDDLDEEELSGLAAKMAKQAKILRQNTSLLEDEDEDEDEAEEDEEERNEKKAVWGKRKKIYYDADNVDYELYSSDEEAPAEEEAEALRLQRLIAKKLRPEDFDLEDEEEDDGQRSLDKNERTLEEAVKKSEAKNGEEANNVLSKRGHLGVLTKDANIVVEEVEKDVSALSKEEQMNAIMSGAPELVGLLAELREGLDELHNKIEPLLVKVKGCSHANKGGLQFLETKRMLLLCYSQSILFYLLMKAEGRSVRDHPVIARLVEIRTLLPKPMEKKLQNQIDKISTSSKEFLAASNNKAHDNLKPSVQLPVTLSEGEEKLQAPDASLLERTGLESSTAKISEVESLTETHKTDALAPIITLRQAKARATIHSDEDEAVPDSEVLHRIIGTKAQKRKPMISGDMDLPLKEGLGERRAKLEMRKVPQHLHRDDSDEEENFTLDEDDFYQEAKRLKVAKQAAKEKESKKIILQEPIVENEVGKRHISYLMEKNKGLTPHRKKLTKNPCKKYKLDARDKCEKSSGQMDRMEERQLEYVPQLVAVCTSIVEGCHGLWQKRQVR